MFLRKCVGNAFEKMPHIPPPAPPACISLFPTLPPVPQSKSMHQSNTVNVVWKPNIMSTVIHYINGSSFIQNKTSKSIKNPNYCHQQFREEPWTSRGYKQFWARGNSPQLGYGSQPGSLFCEMTACTCKVQTPSSK